MLFATTKGSSYFINKNSFWFGGGSFVSDFMNEIYLAEFSVTKTNKKNSTYFVP